MTRILGQYRKRNDFLDLQLWFVKPIIYKMFVHIKYKKKVRDSKSLNYLFKTIMLHFIYY